MFICCLIHRVIPCGGHHPATEVAVPDFIDHNSSSTPAIATKTSSACPFYVYLLNYNRFVKSRVHVSPEHAVVMTLLPECGTLKRKLEVNCLASQHSDSTEKHVRDVLAGDSVIHQLNLPVRVQ